MINIVSVNHWRDPALWFRVDAMSSISAPFIHLFLSLQPTPRGSSGVLGFSCSDKFSGSLSTHCDEAKTESSQQWVESQKLPLKTQNFHFFSRNNPARLFSQKKVKKLRFKRKLLTFNSLRLEQALRCVAMSRKRARKFIRTRKTQNPRRTPRCRLKWEK